MGRHRHGSERPPCGFDGILRLGGLRVLEPQTSFGNEHPNFFSSRSLQYGRQGHNASSQAKIFLECMFPILDRHTVSNPRWSFGRNIGENHDYTERLCTWQGLVRNLPTFRVRYGCFKRAHDRRPAWPTLCCAYVPSLGWEGRTPDPLIQAPLGSSVSGCLACISEVSSIRRSCNFGLWETEKPDQANPSQFLGALWLQAVTGGPLNTPSLVFLQAQECPLDFKAFGSWTTGR
ncbi:uncharacterized protein EI97DRAFT_54737 [Westerdykella ornata]|uniref:Uncharacterized protein n=1 Tax=Westerdykella ornata TaxID=318751 RepID=A0A6A6JIC2_WESOR|nr:uncharacterized protein EI97DRAFT_54737 [Westerdykella ornata]KAF2276301.1 hypothetical protein EI97DRAFT_54737 [Westerdykella ornata]